MESWALLLFARWSLALPGLLAFAGSIPAPVEPPDFPQRQVRCAEIAFSLAVETRDRAAFASLVDADARFVGQGVLRGREQVVAGWSVFFDNEYPRLAWRPSVIEVLESGDLALSRGPYLLTTREEDGGLRESWGLFNSVWRLDDRGHWRVVFDAGNEASGLLPADYRELLSAPTDCPVS